MPDQTEGSRSSPVKFRDQGDGFVAEVIAREVTTTAANGAVSIAATATLARAANGTRRRLSLRNNSTTAIYWGKDNTVTTSNGMPLKPDEIVEIEAEYTGAIYAITTTGTADVRYWEVG